MSERDGFPHGVPCWVECLTPDPAATGRFYAALFGWTLEGPGPMPDRDPAYYVARLRGRGGADGLPAGGPAGGAAGSRRRGPLCVRAGRPQRGTAGQRARRVVDE